MDDKRLDELLNDLKENYDTLPEYTKTEDIMNELWDNEAFIDDNTLTVNMTRIRKKMEEIGMKDVIVTKRGQGYLLSV